VASVPTAYVVCIATDGDPPAPSLAVTCDACGCGVWLSYATRADLVAMATQVNADDVDLEAIKARQWWHADVMALVAEVERLRPLAFATHDVQFEADAKVNPDDVQVMPAGPRTRQAW
jgi:hypothetical protein